MNILFDASAPVLRGWNQAEDFSVSVVPKSVITGSASSAPQTIADITYSTETSAGYLNTQDIAVSNSLDNPAVELSSDTPNVCTVDQLGNITPLQAGACSVRLRGQTGERINSHYVINSGGGTAYTGVTALGANSLRKYLYDQQVAAFAGEVPGGASQRAGFYGNGIAAGLNTVVAMVGSYGGANPSNLLRASGKAGFAGFTDLNLLDQVLDSGHAGNGAGWRAWISPHHFLTWRGHQASSGATWVAINSEMIVEYSATPWAGALAKLLPADYATYMPLLPQNWGQLGSRISCFARLFNTYDNKSDATAERRWIQPVEMYRCFFAADDPRKAFQLYKSDGTLINGGDSGSPVFCGINGDLVMISHVQTQYNIGSMFYADYITQINAAMATLNASGAYTVQAVDLGPTGMNLTSYP